MCPPSLALLLLNLLFPPALAAPPAFPWQPTIPANFGTQSSNADERDVRAISHDLGAHWLRIECGWTSVESHKGNYDFTGIDKSVSMLFAENLEPIIIFDYGNPLYEKIDGKDDIFCGPTTPEAQQGYGNFCAAVAEHLEHRFTDHVFVYELWNEPNFEWFWHPKPEASAYTRLCKLAYPAIKKAAPYSIVIGPATSSAKGKFIADCIDGGILDSLDAFSVHPYRHTAPETVIEDYAALRKLIADRNTKDGRPDRIVPLISSEWGYSATPDKSIGISCDPRLQGPYLTRMWLINAWQEIGISIWFQWRGGSDESPDPWSKFGLTREDRSPRPSFTAAKTLIDTLRGYRCIGRIDIEGGEDYVLRFQNDKTGGRAFAAWTAGEPHSIRVPWTASNRCALLMMTGERSEVSRKEGKIELPLSGSPLYLLTAD